MGVSSKYKNKLIFFSFNIINVFMIYIRCGFVISCLTVSYRLSMSIVIMYESNLKFLQASYKRINDHFIFNIFVNDLPNAIKYSQLFLFDDDAKLLIFIHALHLNKKPNLF